MSDQLRGLGIELYEGYGEEQLSIHPDLWVIGNAISRGNPLLEAILNAGEPYTSGPQWISEHILQGRHVMAVAGTHGKTTTSSVLAWILEACGKAPVPDRRRAVELQSQREAVAREPVLCD